MMLVVALVVLLTFRDDIAGGAAGCFTHIAAGGGAAVVPEVSGPAGGRAADPREEGSARETSVEVRVIRRDDRRAVIAPEAAVDAAEGEEDVAAPGDTDRDRSGASR